MAIALSLTLFGAAACSKDEPAEAPTATVVPSGGEATSSPTASATASPPAPTAGFLAPLTGMPAETAISNRPFAVMINNLAPARPQSGLTQADTVWELLAEGGITRLVAIFQSKEFTDPIGPIRSIRPYFIEVGEFYNSVLVHIGASNDAFAILQRQKKADLDELVNAGSSFYRDSSRKAPHNAYSTLELLRKGVDRLKYETTVEVPALTFAAAPELAAPELAASAETAEHLDIKFMLSSYKVTYDYDSASALYSRSINDQPHIDKNNGEQLTAANLVVLSTKHVAYDDVGRLEIDLNRGGDAMLFQRGKMIRCEWQRKSGDVIRLYKDGAELPFLPGITYYHVVPSSSSLDSLVTIR